MVLHIKGMGCMHCVAKVTAALKEVGAEIESVEIGKAVIAPFEDLDKLKKVISDAGFELESIN